MKTTEPGITSRSEVFFATPSQRARQLFYYVTCTGHFYYEDTYRLRRQSYNSFLVMYVLRGTGAVLQGEREMPMKKGDVVLLDCYAPHGYRAVKDLETLWVHFDGLNSRSLYEALEERQNGVVPVRDAYMIRGGLQRIYDLRASGSLPDEALESACLSRIFAEFFDAGWSVIPREDRSVEDTIRYIRENLRENLRIKDLAAQAALSEFYFSRWFKAQTGTTPYEYIMTMRVNEGKNLLKSTDRALSDIAVACGFSTEGNFIRAFKKQTGLTPGAFRRMGL